MKSLENAKDVAELKSRFDSLDGAEKARWGQMTVGEMVCHVREAYRAALGERELAYVGSKLPERVMKYVALRSPMPWPQGVQTVPELEVGGSAMLVVAFANDKQALMAVLEAFCAMKNCTTRHPIFGDMKHADWMRWGYLHGEHHLRQFGR